MGEFELLGELSLGDTVVMNYKSGITVSGGIKRLLKTDCGMLLITLRDCTVRAADGNVLFEPHWGYYDLAVGEHIKSVFSGAADKTAFEDAVYVPRTNTFHPVYSDSERRLQGLYQQVRDCREQHRPDALLTAVWQELQKHYPENWLCALEILETLIRRNAQAEMAKSIESFLTTMALQPAYTKLIKDGLYLLRL